MLNSDSFLLNSIDNLLAFSDLGGYNSLVILSLGLLGSLSLDDGLFSLNDGLKTGDFFFNLSLFSLRLNDDLLFFKFLDLLLGVGNSLGASLDFLLRLNSGYSISGLLSLKLSGLTLNFLFGLSNGMSVSQGILFDLNDSMLVGMFVISSSNSVDRSSFNLSRNLQRVGCLSFNFDVVGVVSSPGSINGLNGGLNGGDLSCV